MYSQFVEFMEFIYADLFLQEQYLINQCNLRIEIELRYNHLNKMTKVLKVI